MSRSTHWLGVKRSYVIYRQEAFLDVVRWGSQFAWRSGNTSPVMSYLNLTMVGHDTESQSSVVSPSEMSLLPFFTTRKRACVHIHSSPLWAGLLSQGLPSTNTCDLIPRLPQSLAFFVGFKFLTPYWIPFPSSSFQFINPLSHPFAI